MIADKLRIIQFDGKDGKTRITSAPGHSHLGRIQTDPHGRYGYAAIAHWLGVTAKHPLSWDGSVLKVETLPARLRDRE